jgi:uncharacterized protein with von Willebrand factor type A (vWA) domain
MERYSRMLLHFLHTARSRLGRLEAFVFSTRLTRITRELRERDPNSALDAVSRKVPDWSGGTRIGESLHEFFRHWSRRTLGHGAIVLIISDGWERGDPALLAAEMRRLSLRSHRVVWLNPLAGQPGYAPLTRGMQAALPYVSDLLAAHNVLDLEALAVLLGDVSRRRSESAMTRSARASVHVSH